MVCRSRAGLACLVLLAAAVRMPAAEPPQLGWRLDGRAFLRFGQGIETPHTKWARPSAAGRARALILANRSGAYDVPELARRCDVDVRGMPSDTWHRLGEWYWLAIWIESSSYSERMAHFERMLEDDCDVIVLANFRFLSLSEAAQYLILRKVANGCGLVLFHRHDVDPRLLREPLPEAVAALSRGTPFAGLDFYRNWFMPSLDIPSPEAIGPRLFHAYRFGRGRVLVVDYNEQPSVFAAVPGAMTPPMEYDSTAPVRYDYHQSMAARCVLWAAGRDPRLAWTSGFPDGIEIEAARPAPPLRIRAAWSGSDGVRLTRKSRVRNLWGEVLHESESPFEAKAGPLEWDVALPPLPGGWHFVDCSVTGPHGVENWGSFAVDVRPAMRIDAIEPAAAFYEAGEPITGRVVLSRPAAAEEAASIDMALEDGYGRVFSRTVQPVEAGASNVAFAVPQGHVVSWGARLRMRLCAGGRTIHQEETEIRVRRPDRGEYPIAMWGAISGYGNHIGNLQMRELGFTAVIGDPLAEARDDLGWMTFGGGKGALIHSLGDEIPIPRPGKGAALAAFLRSRYASLEELNAAWGTQFASWEDVEPAYTASDRDAAALDTVVESKDPAAPASAPGGPPDASFVRVHDSLSAGESFFAENIRKRREEIEKTNPLGVVGPEGSPVGDPELTLPQATFWGPYLADRDNLLVNALARPGVLRGNWFGGYVEDRRVPTRNRHRLWMSILGGNNMIEYFMIDGGLLAPDLTRMPFVEEFLPSWQQIRRGLGPQLATCRPTGNPVALLHSQASQHIGQAIGGEATDTVRAHEYVLNLLGDAGYSPQYVASGQVRAGRLREADVRVLLLVQAYALSDAEVTEIRAFADRGGTVIADVPPAGFDERCRRRTTRAMDEFFGAGDTTSMPSLREQVRRMGHVATVTTEYGPMLLRGAHAAAAAEKPGGPAGLRVERHGAGRSILLNGVLWLEGREDPGTVRAWRQMIEKGAGVRPAFEMTYRQPLGKLGTRVYSYRRGDIHIDAVLPPEATDAGIPVRPVFTWDAAKHTYDMRQERYVGNVREAEQEIERSSPAVLARLDYKVGAVRLEAGRSAGVGGVLDLRCSVRDTDGKDRPGHVIRVGVVGPDGKDRPYYGAMLRGDGPVRAWRIPFALNDPAGTWTIAATDVVSGVSATAAFELHP